MKPSYRFRAGCRCGWQGAESLTRVWARAEATAHQDYLTGHLTFISWRDASLVGRLVGR